jgi:hypothetical protein
MSSRRRFATPAQSLLIDSSPGRGLPVRRESEGVVPLQGPFCAATHRANPIQTHLALTPSHSSRCRSLRAYSLYTTRSHTALFPCSADVESATLSTGERINYDYEEEEPTVSLQRAAGEEGAAYVN